MEKNCGNCYFWDELWLEDDGIINPKCCYVDKCVDKQAWQPDYQTLESQLQQMKAAVPDYDVLEQTDQEGLVNIVVEIVNQLEQYKEALRLACEHYQKKINCLECFVEYFLNKVKEAANK